MNHRDSDNGDDAPGGRVDRDRNDTARPPAGDREEGGKAAADRAGGVRRQDGPEPYDEARRPGGRVNPVDATPGVPNQSGYEENGPGRGDYPGRGRGDSTRPRQAEDQELDARSRWRDADRDEGSERWTDDPGDSDKPSP